MEKIIINTDEAPFPLGMDVVFKRRNSDCIDLYILNELKVEQWICFFNQYSMYAKDLQKQYKIDFLKL